MPEIQQKRRKQVRLAQRAYRYRQTSIVSSLSTRSVQLESALSDMASTMVKLRNMLSDSDASTQHPEYASLCLASDRSLSLAIDLGAGQSLGPDPVNPAPLPARLPPPITAFPGQIDVLPEQVPTGDLVDDCFIGYSAFIERLRISIVYFAYRAVVNKVPTPGRISRPFWLLGTVMNQDRMASFFCAAIHSRIMRTDIGREWDDVPIFTLGASVCGRMPAQSTLLQQPPSEHQLQRWRRVEVPLESLPHNIRSEYQGSWLDAEQLEEYLRTTNVKLYSPSSNTNPRMLTGFGGSAVNTTRLIAGKGF